ncbi:MAG: hypothetical protein ABIG43_03140 [Chloroflexota bacterium]
MRLSKRFIEKIKLSSIPAYKLAWEAGLHPNTLSKFITGYLKPKPFDERLLRVGELLGLDRDDVFEAEEDA